MTTLPPIDPRRSERHLLAAVHRWARTNGWRTDPYRGYRWVNGTYDTMTRSIDWSNSALVLHHVTDRRVVDNLAIWSQPTVIRVASVVQAVDVLVALGILPAWLSSAYGLAEDRYREQVETLTEELERSQGAYRDVVADWAERADMFTVGARVEIGGPR